MANNGVPACFFSTDAVSAKVTGLQICRACETVTGDHGVEGCQPLRGVWRIYASSRKARDLLLTKGITIDRQHVAILGINPKIAESDNEIVKLTIGAIPLSVANEEIIKALKTIPGMTILSNLEYETYRNEKGGATSFKTGRRFVFIDKPNHFLGKHLKVMKWRATLYHFGQRELQAAAELQAKETEQESPLPSMGQQPTITTGESTNVSLTDQSLMSQESAPSPDAPVSTLSSNTTVSAPVASFVSLFKTPTNRSRAAQRSPPGRRARSESHGSTGRKRLASTSEPAQSPCQKPRKEAGGVSQKRVERIDYFDFDPTSDK